MNEELILGLRLIEGVSEKTFFEKYGVSIYDAFPKSKVVLNVVSLLKNGNIAINFPYLYLGNYVLSRNPLISR